MIPEIVGFLLNCFLPSVVNIILYACVFKISRTQRKRIQIQIAAVAPTHQNEHKKIRIYQYVMVLFLITWLPFDIYVAYTYFYLQFYYTCIGATLELITASLISFNAVLNGLIYSSVSKTFRNKVKVLLKLESTER